MPASPIVVPTDLSVPAAEALAYALRLARATGSRVHLLHVLSWPDAGPFEIPGDAPTAAQEDREEVSLARAALLEVAGSADVIVAVRHGNVPALEVEDYARAVGADLVVMGMSGRRKRGRILGSVAAEVIHSSSCDVLLVPHRPGTPFSSHPVRRVLVPVDFSSASRTLVALGCRLARDLDAQGVDVVHVIEPLPHPLRWVDETLLMVAPQIRERATTALRDLAATVDVPDAPEVSLYVEDGNAERTIIKITEALGSDLLVVGPHAERPIFDHLLGSVAEGIARRSTCPVWIARRSANPELGTTPAIAPRALRSE